MVGQSFAEIMHTLRNSTQTRPTQLDLLHVESGRRTADVVSEWLEHQTAGHRLEGEFDVDFRPHQRMGIRLSETYLMTNPLQLAGVNSAMASALAVWNPLARVDDLVSTVLVRIGEHSVLGAPLKDVTQLLQDPVSFPKELWLARLDNLHDDYYVVTLMNEAQLVYFCFVPIEVMMEVPVVCLASKSPIAKDTEEGQSLDRSDGVAAGQYLMAINGLPTLRLSATNRPDAQDQAETLMDSIAKALEPLHGSARTLRFRDMPQYRREMQARLPLSPWNRILRQAGRPSLEFPSGVAAKAKNQHASTKGESNEQIQINRRPRDFYRFLLEEMHNDDQSSVATLGEMPASCCEGVRRVTARNVRTIIIQDNLRPVGMQLETELMTTYTVFKQFTRYVLPTCVFCSFPLLSVSMDSTESPAATCNKIQRGDVFVSVDSISVDEIPTDALIRRLHGLPLQSVGDQGQDIKPVQERRIRLARRKDVRLKKLMSKIWTLFSDKDPTHVHPRQLAAHKAPIEHV